MLSECRVGNILDNSVETFTVTFEVGLYCEKQSLRDTIQSSMYLGSVLGLVVMNLASDKYGRKRALLISMAIAVTGWTTIAMGAFCKVTWPLLVGQILQGFGAYPCFTISYIVLADLFSDRLRQLGLLTVNAAWGLG